MFKVAEYAALSMLASDGFILFKYSTILGRQYVLYLDTAK